MKFEEIAVWGFIGLGVLAFFAFPEKSDGIFWTIVGIFAGILLFAHGFILWKQKNMIEKTPTSKVRSMAMGQVEVEGKALTYQKALTSAFGQIDSVYCKLTIDEQRGKHSYRIYDYESSFWFRLEDDTGETLINPNNAEFHLEDITYSMGVMDGENSEACENGLTRLKIPLKSRLGLKRIITARETVIPVSQYIYVMGNATHVNQSDFQGDKDPTVVIEKGRDHLFLISNERQSDLLGSLTWSMNFCLFGGPVISAACLLWLMSYL